MVKSLEFPYSKRFTSFFFVLVESYSISPVCLQRSTKKALFLASFKVSTDNLFDNLESGKRNYCFGKKVCKKSWTLGPTNLYEPCNNAFVGALFALCRRGIQPPLNARVVFRIIIVLIFFNNTLLYTPCYFSINDRFKVAWLTVICLTNLTV